MARVRIRIYLGDGHSLGPGKIQLFEAVREHGSISAAARSIGMAYRHGWELIDDMMERRHPSAPRSESRYRSTTTRSPIAKALRRL